MATTPQQGIMALPETEEAATPQISLNESYAAAKQGLTEAGPQFTQMYDEAMAEAMPALLALSDEELDMLLQLVQYLQENPAEYAKNLQELEQSGIVEQGDFPAQYDENFLSVLGATIMEAKKNNQPEAPAQAMQPPMQLAKGGIAEAARMVASQGRSGDTMLAHINKDEAKLLKKHGGMGTINPRTGLREYGLLSNVTSALKTVAKPVTSAFKSAVGVTKKILSSPVGRIAATVALATFLGPGAFGVTGMGLGSTAAMGLASAGVTALSGGNLKDIIKSGVTGAVAGYGAEALGPVLGGTTGVTSAAGQAALGAGATGAGMGLVQGKSIKDSVKDGMAAAVVAGTITGAQKGFMTPAEAGQVKIDKTTGDVTTAGQSNVPTAQPAQPPAAASTDPLGDFIAQNEAFRVAANTPVPPPPTPEATWWDKTTDFFSPTARAEAGNTSAIEAVKKQFPGITSEQIAMAPAGSPVAKAFAAATPGVLSNYGPAIGAGLGIAGLAGGFTPQQPDAPDFSQDSQNIISGKATQDIISANPRQYITQNLPGVTYDAAGNITGSSSWTPRSGAPTNEVAGNYAAYSAPTMTTPSYLAPISTRTVAQPATPYNTASMYDFRPRYAAQGGMMETRGAFPANPLSMPSDPAMGMQMGQPVSMDTSGVPMNRPVGFASGGFTSSAVASPSGGSSSMPTGGIFGSALAKLVPYLQEATAANKPFVPFDLANAASEEAAKNNLILAALRKRQEMQKLAANQQAGIASLAVGGYPRRTGQISGPGTPTSDDIPAMLSDGEFVFTEKAVRGMGNGSRREGAKKMYALMHRLEKNAARG